MTKVRNALQLVAYVGGVTLAAAMLQWTGQQGLALPEWSVDAWTQWTQSTDPAVLTFSLVRGAAIVALWYLVATMSLSILAQLARLPSMIRFADLISLPAVRRLSRRAVGLTLAGTLAIPGGALAATATPEADDVPVLRHVGRGGVAFAASTTIAPTATTMAPPVSTTTVTPPAESEPVEGDTVAVSTGAARTWSVRPGDSLWTIADAVLREVRGGSPSDAELDGYWRRLVEMNRSALTDRDNPDLIFPGQILSIPAP